jgi:predicted NACHT family NTPase
MATLTLRRIPIRAIEELEPAHQSDIDYVTSGERVEASVQVGGRAYRASVFKPDAGGDLAYLLASSSGQPVDDASDYSDDASISRHLDELYAKLSSSEAIDDTQRVNLATFFIEPTFEIEAEQSKSPQRAVEGSLSWRSLQRFARLVIVGAPGAGKTSALRRLALEWAKGDGSEYIPTYLQLRNYDSATYTWTGLEALVLHSFGDHGQETFAQVAASGRLMVLLDGLDEIPVEVRRSVAAQIDEFARTHPTVGIVVTCRDYIYDSAKLPGFVSLRLTPFDRNQIARWSRQNIPESALCDVFLRSLRREPGLMELVSSPLLLSMAVALFRRHGVLPRRRAAIIATFVSALLQDWDSARGVVRQVLVSDPRDRFNILTQVAYWVLIQGGHDFDESDLDLIAWNYSRQISLEELSRSTGLIQRSQNNRWWFTHRVFQDYFAAEYCVRSTRDASALLANTASNLDEWKDVWLLVTGLTPDASDMIRQAWSEDLDQFVAARLIYSAMTREARVEEDVRSEALNFVVNALMKVFVKLSVLNTGQLDRDSIVRSLGTKASAVELALLREVVDSLEHPFTRESLHRIEASLGRPSHPLLAGLLDGASNGSPPEIDHPD